MGRLRDNIKGGVSRLLGLPLSAETLIRNLLLLGFLVLLLIIAGMGYSGTRGFLQLEGEIVELYESSSKHSRTVIKLQELIARMSTEARALLTTPPESSMHRVAEQKLREIRQEVDGQIRSAHKTRLVEVEALHEFERQFAVYWDSIHGPPGTDWSEERDRLGRILVALEEEVVAARSRNDEKVRDLSIQARQQVTFATIAALLIGGLVASLSFYEIRRILLRFGTVYRESSESRDYLQSLFDSLVSGVIVVDESGEVKSLSASFQRIMGLSKGLIERGAIGKPIEFLLADRPRLAELVRRELASPTGENQSYGRIEFEGRLFEVIGSPLVITGELRGLILVFVDVTEAEKARRQLQSNQALTAVGQMTAQIAHEIKNPLGSIRFATEILRREGPREGPAEEVLSTIERSVSHLAAIVTELSEFARPGDLELGPLDMNRLLDDVLPMVADRLEAKQIVVRKSFDTNLPIGRFDGTELRKLFLNLIINAVDASQAGAKIEIVTSSGENGWINVDVIDSGIGMDEEELGRVFEPFFTTKPNGTGLGMAISKKIIELHRGDLKVESARGEGTRVTIRLPVDTEVSSKPLHGV